MWTYLCDPTTSRSDEVHVSSKMHILPCEATDNFIDL